MDIEKYTELHQVAITHNCDDALTEGFFAGVISGRDNERNRLYEKLVDYQGGYIESDMVVIPQTIPIATVFEWLRK